VTIHSAETVACEQLLDCDGVVEWFSGFYAPDQAAMLQHRLEREIPWTQHRLRLFGRWLPAPRLSAWHGDPGCDYGYSGQRLVAQPLTTTLQSIRCDIERHTGLAFNCVLLNWYRDGRDSMSWHADDEPELGDAPDIASLSLGATRRFLLRHRSDPSRRMSIDLLDGSLLVMRAPLQTHWQHSVPKTRRPVGGRVNLTWRSIDPTKARGSK
jgi:alkylated DNA repair dioxygenase AlkB